MAKHEHDEAPEAVEKKPEPVRPDPDELTLGVQVEGGKVVLGIFTMQASEQNGMVSIHGQTSIMTLNLDSHSADRLAAAIKAASGVVKGLAKVASLDEGRPDIQRIKGELDQKAAETVLIPRRLNRHHTEGKPLGPRYCIITEDKG